MPSPRGSLQLPATPTILLDFRAVIANLKVCSNKQHYIYVYVSLSSGCRCTPRGIVATELTSAGQKKSPSSLHTIPCYMATSTLPFQSPYALLSTMSLEMLTPNQSPQDVGTPAHHQHTTITQRVLACVLCQQRKVKCDRKFPCANCMKAGVQCISAALAPRQRRRRFPERELLDRLRHYEEMLRRNKISFEPLHPSSSAVPSPHSTDASGYDAEAQDQMFEAWIEDPATPNQAK